MNSLKQDYLLTLLLVAMVGSSLLLSYIPGGNYVNFFVVGVLTAVTLGYVIIARRGLWIGAEILALFAWYCYSLLPSLFAISTDQALVKVTSMAQLIVLVIVIIQVCLWNNSSRPIIWAYIAAMCASFLVTFTPLNDLITQAHSFGDVSVAGSQARTSGTLANANTFGVAAVLAQTLIMVLFTFKNTDIKERLLGLIAFAILSMAVLNSGSRTAMIGLFLLILGSIWVFSVWHVKNAMSLIKWLTIVSVVSGTLFFVLKDVEEVQERYISIFEEANLAQRVQDLTNMVLQDNIDDEQALERSGKSLEIRSGYAAKAWEVASENPFGVGLDNFAIFSGGYAHSNYLEVLANTGFLGLILYYLVYFLLGLKSLKLWTKITSSQLPKALIVGVLVLSAMDIAHVSYYRKTVWIYLAILMVTAEILLRNHQSRRRRRSHKTKSRRRRKPSLKHSH